MTTMQDRLLFTSAGDAHRAIYVALLRAGQREPDDFVFGEPPVDFMLRRSGTALSILTPSNRQAGAAQLQAAALQGMGVRVEIVDESEAIRVPDRVVSRLLNRS